MISILRPQVDGDLQFFTGEDSPFDDCGPRSLPQAPASAALEDSGGLTVIGPGQQAVGEVTWHWRQWGPTAASRCPMIGIWLRPSFRGQGLGARAQAELARLFFEHTTTNRVEAHTDLENHAERRALEAAGFTQEGITRGAQWRRGQYRDGVLYSVLRQEVFPGNAPSA